MSAKKGGWVPDPPPTQKRFSLSISPKLSPTLSCLLSHFLSHFLAHFVSPLSPLISFLICLLHLLHFMANIVSSLVASHQIQRIPEELLPAVPYVGGGIWAHGVLAEDGSRPALLPGREANQESMVNINGGTIEPHGELELIWSYIHNFFIPQNSFHLYPKGSLSLIHQLSGLLYKQPRD